ncbi:2-hydroxy-3-oxopropionate reductase [Tenuibacillus multivorans]|uniref:2-hydroxy-3-oxopropionate reductase n=1 Tax=Tenuibacillus multivorans TaxID=237069 RepID=A0A1H0AVQ0_9BACI|nr:2-hydroxy-3-oxopropionate reductase [Tenuibacillus multivorans]GEL77796.1 2-hydroxy-3-oxopropionate reductase [Tenuibacillus multivorans]SDN37532.1 2-hydroxy-3-oxopropionate reductase [Tenuibacillus multivorans]
MKIGFIGLGIMGKPMCKNLIKAGYDVVVSSSKSATNDEMKKAGAEVVSSYSDLASQVDVVITILPNSPEVKDVIFGENGIADDLKTGATVIDMSSIAPLASQEVSEALHNREISFMDAPVSGGEPKAIDGTVSVMVGSDLETFNRCKPILDTMAGSVVRVGDVGAGNSTKLANQIIVALNIAAVSEAFVLANKMGVDLGLMHEAIRGGLAGSTVLDAKGPMMIDRNFEPGFKIDLHLKDLNNVMETANELDVSLPLTNSMQKALEKLTTEGYGHEDHSGILRYFEDMNRTE